MPHMVVVILALCLGMSEGSRKGEIPHLELDHGVGSEVPMRDGGLLRVWRDPRTGR